VIVVDTNILAYRFIKSSKSAEAEALMALDPRWAAPLLWRSEMRNVLSGYLRRGQISRSLAEQVLNDALWALAAGEHAVEDKAIFDLVQSSRCTSYDCEYVALAEIHDVLLITEDRDLLNAFPERCRSLAQAVR
jgi:predicted nucleic acid-binding protein